MTTTMEYQKIGFGDLKPGLILMRWNNYLRYPNEFEGYEPVILTGFLNGYVSFYGLRQLQIVDWSRVNWEPTCQLAQAFLSADERNPTKYPASPYDDEKVASLWKHIIRRRDELRNEEEQMEKLLVYSPQHS